MDDQGAWWRVLATFALTNPMKWPQRPKQAGDFSLKMV
jgi:hypothetical protein